MKALDAMLPANAGERRTLADIIFSKLDNLEAGESEVATEKRQHGACLPFVVRGPCSPNTDPDRAPDPAAGLDPKVVEVYNK